MTDILVVFAIGLITRWPRTGSRTFGDRERVFGRGLDHQEEQS
jgi:hypothetical protein